MASPVICLAGVGLGIEHTVSGLWQLLQPVARPIALETMGNKRMAIDSSIWVGHLAPLCLHICELTVDIRGPAVSISISHAR